MNAPDFDGGDSLDIAPRDGLVDARFNPASPAVDAADPHCTLAWQNTERPACGLGFEVTPLLAYLLARRRRRT